MIVILETTQARTPQYIQLGIGGGEDIEKELESRKNKIDLLLDRFEEKCPHS